MEILRRETEKDGLLLTQGILEVLPDGYGFLRVDGHTPSQEDVYVSPSQIRRFHLRTGDVVLGQVRPPKENERYYALLRVIAVNSLDPERPCGAPALTTSPPSIPTNASDWKSKDKKTWPPGSSTSSPHWAKVSGA